MTQAPMAAAHIDHAMRHVANCSHMGQELGQGHDLRAQHSSCSGRSSAPRSVICLPAPGR